MSENLHDIDKLFQDGLGSMEEMPSGKVWEQLDHALDKKHLAQTRRRYSRLKWYSAALLLLLIGTLFFQLNKKEQTGNREVASGSASKDPIDVPNQANEIKRDQQASAHPAEGDNQNNNAAAADPSLHDAVSNDTNKDKPSTVSDNKDDVSATAPGMDAKTSAIPAHPAGAKNRKSDAGKIAGANIKATAAGADHADRLQGSMAEKAKSAAAKLPERKRSRRNSSNDGFNGETAGLVNAATGIETPNGKNKNGKHIAASNRNRSNSADDTDNAAGKEGLEADKISKSAVASNPRELTGQLLSTPIDGSSRSILIAAPDNAAPGIAPPTVMLKKSSSLHFSVMPFFAPQFTSTRVEKDEQHQGGFPQRPPEPDRIRASESYSSSSAIGIMGELALGKNWSVQTGIAYSARRITIQPKKIFAEKDNDGKVKYRFDCSGGYTYIDPKAGTSVAVGDSIVTTASVTRLGYISVPLILNYSFGASRRFSIVPAAGLVGNFRVKQKIETGLESVGSTKENFTRIQGLRSTYFNITAGIALQYNLSRRLSINVIPAGNWAVSSINQNAVVKSYPNAFSIQTGIKIHL